MKTPSLAVLAVSLGLAIFAKDGDLRAQVTRSQPSAALSTADNMTFGGSRSQKLTMNGDSINSNTSPSPFFLRLNPTSPELFRIEGTDGNGRSAPILDINASLKSSTNFFNEVSLNNGGVVPDSYMLYASQKLLGSAHDAYSPILLQFDDHLHGNVGMAVINEYIKAGAMGSRETFAVTAQLDGPSGNEGGGSNNVAGTFNCYMFANDNGTSRNWGAPGGGAGSCFALNTVVMTSADATWLRGLDGYELDVLAAKGSSLNTKIGLSIVQLGGDVAQGAWLDEAILLQRADQQVGGQGWLYGIRFGDPQGQLPMDPIKGVMIGAGPFNGAGIRRAASGIDFSNVAFSSSFLKSTGFIVDGSGNTTVKSLIPAQSAVSALPPCNSDLTGARYTVTDALRPAFLERLSGGGSVVAPAFCDGKAWLAG